ncbi:carbonic anhydrase [Streptomonospora nanhaiensis]|uniref:carbonic anhydrase n=1 Tax=Streptomonospora nanhaiensis TaxID=1323731 RepID=UPI001C3924AC|nr:carbonic anhydrase [Streptomonospora nanhaiensis]MBV2364612.1 carbonic anhydrase [Streptomonospora nanhaiensis]MBX9390786.1 carbonic anhydrase [Streptomonospora nanhaiensis]
MAISRRGALAATAAGGAGLLVGGLGALPALADEDAPAPRRLTPDEALDRLKAGNRRWRRLDQRHPREGQATRDRLVAGQHPFALVVGCADSRVPPELVFDQGLGDIFDVRSAGQVLDESVLGSVVYGVEHVHIPLIVVLGHSSCGAVTAAVDVHRGAPLPEGHIGYLVEHILPVVESTPDTGGDYVKTCVTANARHIAAELAADPELTDAVQSGTVHIVAARYDLDTSRVHFLD